MIKKTCTYTNYNDVEVTETAYFNFTEAEIMEQEMGIKGGLAEAIQRTVDAKDAPEIIRIFKKLVLDSYGVKSPDGRRFIKTQELRDEFEQTPMYSQIFMELATNDVAAAEFVNGIMPKNLPKDAVAPAALPNA